MVLSYLTSMLWLSSITVVLLLCTITTASDLQIINNGYEGILISINPEITETYANEIGLIKAIKNTVKKGSQALFTATKNRAFFRKVNILIPNSWNNTDVDTTVGSKFKDGHIHIKSSNPQYLDQPYTQQTQEICGRQGEFIHLTPKYLTDNKEVKYWGRRDKNIATEWAKFRWGVFDEIGFPRDTVYPLFYFYPLMETWQPTLCVDKGIHGKNQDKTTKDGCKNKRDGSPDDNCRFYIFKNDNTNAQIKSSLLSYGAVRNNVSLFCDENTHNKDAPTKQNAVCNKRSTWSVIMDHEDFKNNRNAPTSVKEETQFQIVQQTSHINFVLVLDYSGSMNSAERLIKLQAICQRWIKFSVAEGNSVAIVKFSTSAIRHLELTKITKSNRDGIANGLDAKSLGGTNIDSGVQMALQVLKTGGRGGSCILLVLTDGVDSNPIDPDSNAKAAGCRVITIAFGPSAEESLETLATSTDGKTFFIADGDIADESLTDAFNFALEYQPDQDSSSINVKIHEAGPIAGTSTKYTDTFEVDKRMSRNLELRIMTDNMNHITTDPFLRGPDGTKYAATAKDVVSKIWMVQVESVMSGTWQYEVGLSGSSGNFISSTVTCQPAEGGELPITITAETTAPADGVDMTVDRVVIRAEVKQGNNPIVGANVIAIVTAENGIDEIYNLLDEGNEPDAIKNDGRYARYLTGDVVAGRFSVKVKVVETDKSVILKPSKTNTRRKRFAIFNNTAEIPDDEDDIPEPCCGSFVPQERFEAEDTGKFSRIKSAGSVKITKAPPSGSDLFPPNRVGDLAVMSTETNSSQESGFAFHTTLTWSAPGDDFDTGIVDNYILRFSRNQEDLFDDSFSSATEYPLSKELFPDIFQEAGTKISLRISLDLGRFKEEVPYYFALKAQDEKNNKSPASNIMKVILPLSTPNIAVSTITSSYSHITWTGNSPSITKYDVTWASNSDDSISIELGPDSNSLGIQGLQCNTQYNISVIARSDQDIKNWVNFASVNLTTYDNAPGQPIIKSIEPNEDHSKLIVQWSEAEYSCRGGLRNYYITWKRDNHTLNFQTLDDITKVGSTYKYAISNVLPDSTYTVTVAATSNTGTMGPMQSQTVDTIKSESLPPGNWILCNCDVKNKHCDYCRINDSSSKTKETRSKRSPQPLAQLMSPSKRRK